MKVALTIPTAGAGKWAWAGWANAFKWFGHEVVDITHQDCRQVGADLVICTTSQPRQDIIEWRNDNRKAKLALNVLAWTDYDFPGINNPGVQASTGNVQYALQLEPDLVFAQYTAGMADYLLSKWKQEGFKIGSMEMAADATVYPAPNLDIDPTRDPDIFYVGGYWAYKAQNLDRYVLPIIRNKEYKSVLVGKGWPQPALEFDEVRVGEYFRNAKVSLNAHEPHSTLGGYDVVERLFKILYCGGLCVTDDVAEIEECFGLYDEQHLFIASDAEDYINIVDDLIADNQAYDDVRHSGYRAVAENHTYFNRALMLMADLRLLEEYDNALEYLLTWHREIGLF